MPRVPTAEGFGVLPTIRSGGARPVLSVEQAAQPGRQMEARGAQMIKIGGQIGDYAQQQQERINRARVQDATRQAERAALEYRQQMEQLKGAQAAEGIEGMPLGAYYSRELERRTAEIEQGLGSPAAREAFRAQSLALQSRFSERAMLYEAQQADVFLQQNLDAEIGHQNDLLIGESSDPIALVERIPKVREAYVAKFREAGYKGDALEQEVKKEMAKSHGLVIENYSKNQQNYEAARTYFEINRGDFMANDAAKMEAALNTQGLELRAIGTADKFWADTGGDYGAAIVEARKIPNVEERTKVEERLAVMKNQDDAAKAAKDAEDLEEGMSYVVQGSSIPAAWAAEASPLVIDRIQAEQRTRALWAQQMGTLTAEERRAVKEASAISKDYFKSIASLNPEAYLAPRTTWDEGMLATWDSLVPEHQAEILSDIAQRQAQGQTFDSLDKTFKDLVAQVPVLGPENMKTKNLTVGSKGTGADRTFTDEEKAVRASLYRQAQEYSARTGGTPVSPQESRVMIARAFREADAKRYPFPEPGRFMVGIVANTVEYDETVTYLKDRLGREPTDMEVIEAMKQIAGGE